jgi:hypothetical protein
MFPRIDRPCPYVDRLASVMDGDFCRMCKRNVIDLDAMEAGARRAFLAGCAEETCVTYRLPVRSALAAAALAAAVAALPAAAQDAPPAEDATTAPATDQDYIVLAGGIRQNPLVQSVTPVTVITVDDDAWESDRTRRQRQRWASRRGRDD